MSEENQTDNQVPMASAELSSGGSRWQRFKAWYGGRKKWTIPASVLLIILILAGLPFTRYALAGTVVKKNFTVQALDATAGTPISGATVSVDSQTAQTDAAGKATLHLKAGRHSLTFAKKYYKTQTAALLTPIFAQKTVPTVQLTATGRQVKVSVTNLINKKPLNGVDISAAGTTAKTDKTGSAVLVLPAGISEQKATLSLGGYNSADVTIKISNDKIQNNPFTLTPAGKVYFLSKLSGKIDVVKTNLDGSDRQTVLAGTGKEDDRGTVLLASRDWKYLALLSRRAGNNASLYLIDTTNGDQLTTIDQGNVRFTLVGWNDNNFVYIINHDDIQPWQPHGQSLKAYNAATKQLLTLDQTDGQGTDQFDYAQQTYGQVYQIGKNLIYEKQWNASYYNTAMLKDKTAGVYSINVNGSNPQTLKTFSYEDGKSTYISSVPYEADQIYYSVLEKDAQSYYAYTNGKITAKDGIADSFNEYYQSPVTYLQSPSGDNTFWAEPRDGKNTLFIGDQDGENGKQIATLSDYFTYGWYTDNYLLVSKNSSELYIMPAAGSKNPVKISDYHKPAVSFNSYGGGYGGL